jgi:hypothetical protein
VQSKIRTKKKKQYVPKRQETQRSPDSMWGLRWTKRHWGRFSPSTSVSLANQSTNFSIIIITRGWLNRPISGRSAVWTQMDSTPPPLYQLKKGNEDGGFFASSKVGHDSFLIFFIWFVRLLALRPLLAYCASLG